MRQGGVAKPRSGPGLRVGETLWPKSSHPLKRDKWNGRKHFGAQGVPAAVARRELARPLLEGKGREVVASPTPRASSIFPRIHTSPSGAGMGWSRVPTRPRARTSFRAPPTPAPLREPKNSGVGLFVYLTRCLSQT